MFQTFAGCVSDSTPGQHKTSVCTFGPQKIFQTVSIDSGTGLSQTREVISKKDFAYSCFDESKTVLPHIDIYQVADDVVGHRRAQGRHSSHNIYIVYGLRASAQKLPSNTKLIRSYTLIHPRQREGLRVLKICCKECIIISVARRGDTRGPKYNPKTAITVED